MTQMIADDSLFVDVGNMELRIHSLYTFVGIPLKVIIFSKNY